MAHPHRTRDGTTTAIKDHLGKRCKAYLNYRSDASSETRSISYFLSGNKANASKPTRLSQDLVEEHILRFFVSGNIPFNQAENESFRTLISHIKINDQPARCPGRTTIRRRLTKYAKEGVEDLKALLAANDSKISLALDCWSSRSNYDFLGT